MHVPARAQSRDPLRHTIWSGTIWLPRHTAIGAKISNKNRLSTVRDSCCLPSEQPQKEGVSGIHEAKENHPLR